MKLKVLGSNSKGNCYILENENSALIIECGIKFMEVKKAINFKVDKIVGALITHSHGDHSKHVKEYLQSGISVYANADTISELNFNHHGWKPLNGKFKIKDWTIIPFDVVHNVRNTGFLLRHPETGDFCFFTDTHYCPSRFSALNNMIVECNYDLNILEKNFETGRLQSVVRNQVLFSHFSFDSCKEFLKANDLSSVNNIVLIHLSDGNSDAKLFQTEIQRLTGKTVHIAQKGMEMDFNSLPF